MALGVPTHVPLGSGTTSAVSNSFTPPALARLFCVVHSRRTSGGDVDANTISDTDGHSSAAGDWVPVNGTGGVLLTSTISIRQQVFTKRALASPTSLVVTTGTSANASFTSCMMQYITGANSDFSNFKVGSDAAGDPAATLDFAPAATSTAWLWFTAAGTATPGTPANYTQLSSNTNSTMRVWSGYDAASAAAAVAVVGTNTVSVATLLEVKEVPDVTGTAAGLIAPLVGAAVGVHGVSGTAEGLIAPLVGAAAGVHGVTGTGAGFIARLVGVASGTGGEDVAALVAANSMIATVGKMMNR